MSRDVGLEITIIIFDIDRSISVQSCNLTSEVRPLAPKICLYHVTALK